ncbi:hypothetical protein [Streptomyces sp. NPDC015345]|uniref:hypothetical protein n=1 Tax=Streptomyces sp. NPDC015345 TaxID=3364953 RepID=UPI0036FAE9CB
MTPATPATEKPFPITAQRCARPHRAGPGRGRGAEVDAEGVLSALPPNPPPPAACGDGRYPVAWLRITAPYGATPTATSVCLCGRDRSAVGRRKVLALITDHAAHRDACPLRTPQEGRNAA